MPTLYGHESAPGPPLDPTLCVVVTSIGRPRPLQRLLASLAAQTRTDFEVIVVDQSDDGSLAAICSDAHNDPARPGGERLRPVRHVPRPGERGASRGRNVGLALTRAGYVLFPDDDCWYPPDFIERAAGALDADPTLAALSGRPVDAHGRTINGRFETRACAVDRRTAWTTQIEWLAVYRRAALVEAGGFDERIGVGAATPWQSSEAQDVVLRLLDRHARLRYDPTLTGRHEEFDTRSPDAAARAKGRRYARGMGHVLGLHGYGPLVASGWIARPLLLSALCLCSLLPRRATYYAGIALGRLQGYLDARPDDAGPVPAPPSATAKHPRE